MLLRGLAVAIVGGSGGIGKATAIRCAEEGADVVIHHSGRTKESELRAQQVLRRVEQIQRNLHLGTRTLIVAADVTKRREVRNRVKEIHRQFPNLTGLALYNGYYQPGLWKKHSGDYTDKEEELIWRTDVLGTKYCIEEFSPYIIESVKKIRQELDIKATGSIVLISSTPALGSIPVDKHGKSISGAYSVAKGAIISLMRHAVIDYSPYIRVNTIAPGNVATGWTEELTRSEKKAAAMETPLRRWINPGEVANVTIFLLSNMSSAVNNQIIAVDGGYITGR